MMNKKQSRHTLMAITYLFVGAEIIKLTIKNKIDN